MCLCCIHSMIYIFASPLAPVFLILVAEPLDTATRTKSQSLARKASPQTTNDALHKSSQTELRPISRFWCMDPTHIQNRLHIPRSCKHSMYAIVDFVCLDQSSVGFSQKKYRVSLYSFTFNR